MRFFRQTALDAWQGVMERVAAELKEGKWSAPEDRGGKAEKGSLAATPDQKELL